MCSPAYDMRCSMMEEALPNKFAQQVRICIITIGLRSRPAITSYGQDGSTVAPLLVMHIAPK